MKKYFIFALIAAIIMSNWFSAVIFAQELGSPSGGTEIFTEAWDEEIEEAEVPDAIIEETAAPDAEIEEAQATDAIVEEAETPDTDSEAIPASDEIADSEEMVGEPENACGANATWSISGSVLKISGSGAMYDYNVGGAPWYSRNSEIKIVLVEDGITQIGGYAFAQLVNVVCVSLPSSLTRIGYGGFFRCSKLSAIEIPAGVTYIDSRAFGACFDLEFISFLGKAPAIHQTAFANVYASVYYLSSGAGWTANNKQYYGGNLNWVSVSTYYDVWVYGVRINSANKNNVFNTNDVVKYNSSSKTLELPRMTDMPMGLAISRDFYEICAPVYAIGDLNLETLAYLNMVNTYVSVYVTGDLTISESDTRMHGVYSGQFAVKGSRANFEGINSGNIDIIENSEIYAYGLTSQDHIVIKDSFVHISDTHPYNLMTCWSCDIQDSNVWLENTEGTAISCYSQFAVSGSYLASRGKIAGINAPYIRILKGNELVAEGSEGAMFGVEDAMSKEIEIAPGYVFIGPENPVIGPYAIMENGQNAIFVNIRPLTSEDKGGLRRGKTAVSSITVPTKSLTQLELRTKDNYFVSADWSSGNSGIASVDKNGLVAAKKYGKTKITCKAGSTTLTCDVQTRFYDVNNPAQPGYKQIYWGVDKGIISGFNGVYFGPDLPCTRLQFAVMMWRAKGKPKASGTLKFKDTKNLNPNTDSYKAILWASNNGIVKGYSDNTFRPNNNITRESIVIILWRMAGQPKAKKALPFKDTKKLSTTSTAYKAIAWASETKIVNGYTDNTFRKDDYCKRFQCIIMIYRFVNR